MKAKRGIWVVVIAVTALAASLGALSYVSYMKEFKEFIADGYILKPSEEVNITTEANEQYYFSQGTKYKAKHGTKIMFKDTAGEDVTIDTEEFVHYADSSLGAFTKGVIMDVTDINAEQYGYYNLTQNTILVKNGKSYEVSTRGEAMALDEFIWKISDTDYMLVSPEVTLELGNSSTITLPDYAQIKYVDNGIVRIIHQTGTYQTISADSFLTTSGGAELNLAGKSFYADGKPTIHLDKISLNDDSYIDLDANDDEPSIKIPQFNVVNGKDGASGANGANGESGEDGTDGSDGVDGGDGSEGMEGLEGKGGSSGGSGGRGTDGSDGLEGDSGVMGYDGKNGGDGTNGEDGKRKDEASGIVSAEVFVRPTVTMETEGYKVTPNSVEMHLNLQDMDSALVPGKTVVTIYDRETMQEVASMPSWGEDLANSYSVVVNATNLAPDKDYLLIVKGEYYSESDDSEGREANLFTKVFRTNSLGVSLEKQRVTDDSITVRTRKFSTDVNTYGVRLYYFDEEGNEKEVGMYTGLNSSTELTFSANNPLGAPALKSNSLYYAELCKIDLTGVSGDVSGTGTAIELRTLKKKPYKNADGGAIASVYPVLSVKNKDNTATLSLQDEIADPDNGITGFRYELYRASEVNAALAKNDLSGLIPAYVVESDHAKDQIFQLNPEDKIEYIGRVVVLFDDNEKSNEYATAFSTPDKLIDSTFPVVTFEIEDVNILHDKITGYVKVNDVSGMLKPYILESRPLNLTITSEYEDTISRFLYVVKQQVSETTWLYEFSCDGLRENTDYTLSVSGPVDTDGSGSVTETEKNTYLAGKRVKTASTKALKLVGIMETDAASAFTMRLNLAAGTDAKLSSDANTKAFYEHEAKAMEELTLKLTSRVRVGENLDGTPKYKEETLGTRKVKDLYTQKWAEDNTSGGVEPEWKLASDFYDDTWLFDNEVGSGTDITYKDDPDEKNGIQKGYVTTQPNKNSDKLVVNPESFGRALTDTVFYSGATFIISAESTSDYTAHDNDYGFTEKGKSIEFVLTKRHVRASDPNDQVQLLSLISNEEAAEHYYDSDNNGTVDHAVDQTIKKDPNLDDKTVVGMRFQSSYPYGDIDSITYRIYELDNEDASPTYNPKDEDSKAAAYIYPKAADNWSEAHLEADATKRNDTTKIGTLVETIEISDLPGHTGASETSDLILYFSDPTHPTLTGREGATIVGTMEPGKTLKRGGRYFISYVVNSNWTAGFDCDSDNGNDRYPYCTYNEDEPVPFYRSGIIDLPKQTPKVHRYPWTSDAISVTWMYRIIDPDATIVKHQAVGDTEPAHFYFYTKTAASSDGVTTVEKSAATKNEVAVNDYIVNTVTDPFRAFTFKVPDGQYYSVLLEYKALDYVAAKIEDTESTPVYKQPIENWTDLSGGKLNVVGRKATPEVTPEADIVGDLEKAIVNEGGYRYRITLQGSNIEKVAALRVTFTAVSDPTKVVVYDPVYLSLGTYQDGETKWASAYVDCSALKELKTATNEVKVTVQAYYSTGVSGFGTYNDEVPYDAAVDKTLYGDTQQLYAIKQLKDGGSYSYRLMSQSDIDDPSTTSMNDTDGKTWSPNGSVFLPRDKNSDWYEDGTKSDGGTGYISAMLGIRRADKSLALPDRKLYSANFGIKFDQDGLMVIPRDSAGALLSETGDHITIEKLALTAPLSFPDPMVSGTEVKQDEVNLTNLFPAIKEIKTETGVHGLYVEFSATGSGAAAGVKLYARISECTDPDNKTYQWLNIYRQWEIEPGQKHTEYYMVPQDASQRYASSVDYYKFDSFKANAKSATTVKLTTGEDGNGDPTEPHESGIALQANGGGFIYPLRIKGLKAETKYNIVIFAYDSVTNGIIDLFSLDGMTTGHAYNKTTAKNVKIKKSDPTRVYTTYESKQFNFGFAMAEGETGTGMEVFYELKDITDSSNPKVIISPAATDADKENKNGYIPPNTAGSLLYYSQLPTGSEVTLNFNPGGLLKVGHEYELVYIIKDTLEGDDLGVYPDTTKAKEYTVRIPVIKPLNKPTIRLATSKGTSDGSPTVKANVVVTDEQHSMMEYTVSVYDADTNKLLGKVTEDVRKETGSVFNKQFEFKDGITSGTRYLVRLEATVDLDNDGIPDETKVIREMYQSMEAEPTAVLSASFTGTTLNFQLKDTQNFSQVKSIQYAIYTTSGSYIGGGEGDVTTSNPKYAWTGGSLVDGVEYTIQVQYYNGSGKMIGNVTGYATYHK